MTAGGNLDIALRIQADFASARTQLQAIEGAVLGVGKSVDTSNTALARNNAQLDTLIALTQQSVVSLQSMDAQLGKLSATAAGAASANASVATTAHEAAAATKVMGESQTEAAARIRAMVAASREQTLANGAVAESERSLAERAGARIELSAAERVAIQASAEATRAKVAAEIEALAADDGETVAVEANTAAHVENAAAKKLNARTSYSLSALISDAATGQFGRSRRELGALANETGLLSKLMSPLGLSIGAVAVGIGLFGLAAYKAYEQESVLNKALALTGNYAGLTSSSFESLARDVTRANGSLGDSRTEILALASSGTVGAESLHAMAVAAGDLATLTGENAKKAAGETTKLFDGTARGAAKANEQYHFLTQEQYEQIRALQELGDKEGAARLEAEAFDQSVRPRIADMTVEVTGLALAWKHVGGFIKDAATTGFDTLGKEASLALGFATLDTQIADLQLRKKNAATDASGHVKSAAGVVDNILGEGFGPQQQAELDQKLAQRQALQQQAAARAKTQKLNTNATNAAGVTDGIEKKYATPSEQKDAELKRIINAYNTRMAAALASGDRKLYDDLQTRQAQEISRANAFYAKKGSPIDRAELGAATQDASQQLKRYTDAFTNAERVIEAGHKAGTVSDQAYWQTRRQDLATFEQQQVTALEREKASVATHGTTAADRIRISQRVEGINEQIDKARADAAAKRNALDEQQHQADLRKAQDAAKIEEAYLSATGHDVQAATQRVQQKYAKPLAAATLNGDTGTAAKIHVIIDSETAKLQLADLKDSIAQTFAGQQRQEQDIQAQLQAGLITQIDAQKQLVALHQQTYAAISAEVPKAQALALATGDDKAVHTVEQITSEMNKLGLSVDRVTASVRNTFQGAFDNVFTGLGTQITTVRQLFTTLILDITSGIQRIAAQNLSQALTTQLSGVTSGLSRLLGGTGGTTADAATASATAVSSTAITTAGATAAASIGTAGTGMASAIISAGSIAASAIGAAAAGGGATGGSLGGVASLFGGSSGSSVTGDGGSSTAGWVTAIASLFGGGYGSSGSFDVGGYTGDAPTHQVAGVVHGGEHVTRAAVVQQPGARPLLDALNTHGMAGLARHVRGYAAGGFVGAPALRSVAMPSFPTLDTGGTAHSRAPMNLHVINVPHHSLVSDYLTSRAGHEHVLNIIDNNPTRVRRSIGGS